MALSLRQGRMALCLREGDMAIGFMWIVHIVVEVRGKVIARRCIVAGRVIFILL